jgi:UTP--glucose-1-phosphate uridylyltransferase
LFFWSVEAGMSKEMNDPHACASESLAKAISQLEPALRERLRKGGFDPNTFLALAGTLRGDAVARRRTRNVVRGAVAAPSPGQIAKLPAEGTPEHAALFELGQAALRRGEVAFCTMAGGMATRMGGVVKALVPVIGDRSFLQMRLAENANASRTAGRAVPLWIMTSEATHAAIEQALANEGASGRDARAFRQNLSLRLTLDGEMFSDREGRPSEYATGHGDLVDALRRSGKLSPFVAGGGKYVWITNVDNLGASIDPVVLGHFVAQAATGVALQCEVCRKEGDKGGIPVHAEGKLQVLEEFRLPPEFDPTTVHVFNTNTFLVQAESLLNVPFTWTYFEVEKTVDGRPAIQFERLLQEMTAQIPTTYLEVPRDGIGARFLPVKDFDELERRRPTIERVARARGMV